MQKQFTTSTGWKNDGIDLLYDQGIFANCYGENTGNNVFALALNIFLANPISFDYINKFSPGDAVFWTPANFLNQLSVPPSCSPILLQHAANLYVIGIGVQATLSIDEINLKTETREFLRLLEASGAKFIARGRFSQAYMDRIHITSSAIGCPSLLYPKIEGISNLLRLKEGMLRDPLFRVNGKLGLSFTPYIKDAGHRQEIMTAFGNLQNVTYIAQTEINLARMAAGVASDHTLLKTETEGLPASLVTHILERKKIIFDLLPTRLIQKLLISVDFYISERIHGAVLALTNGIPTIVCCTDLRTIELCELMGIPHVFPSSFTMKEKLSIDDLVAIYLDQVGEFENVYSKAQNALIKYLHDQNINSVYRDFLEIDR